MTAPGAARPDTEARRAIREDLDATLFVEAAAGTGKTTVLVSRIAALLRSGRASLERIVSVTFTEKAAGEMKLRLRAEIERARQDPSASPAERERLDAALGQLELARIGTIHSFCADLLGERPLEAGIDPQFEVAGEDESRRLLDAAFETWFQRVLARPPEAVARVLRRRERGRDALGPRDQLRAAADRLVEHRDFDAPWRRDPLDRRAALDQVMEQLAGLGGLAARAARPGSYLARNFQEVERFVAENALREAVQGRDYDGLEAELRRLARLRSWRYVGSGKSYGGGLSRADVLETRDAVKRALDDVLEACDADLAAGLREDLRPVVAGYDTLKRRAGVLDFLDLLIRARDLVRSDAEVRRDFQERFTHFFVDEFQDTDPLQAELILLLAADDPRETDWSAVTPVAGKLFLVGDPKQSIYRFRRADVAVYEAVKRQLVERGARLLNLCTSFRALPALQAAVNAAFAPVMRAGDDGGQAEYVPLEPSRDPVADRPAVVALPAPRPYGDFGTIVNWRIEESLPDAVAAFVHWLVRDSGWTIEERDRPGERVAIRERHVCLLFRRFKSFNRDVTRPYVRALEARRLPHVLVGGRSFHQREEVLALRNALAAIEWPSDSLRVFATLRGPLFALGDDALLAYRSRVGRFHPLRRLEAGELAKLDEPEREVADALAVLGDLHVRRNRRPIAETLTKLLETVRAHAAIAIWPTGEQALANCLRVIDLARRYERGGAPSFRAFVDHVEEQAAQGEAQDAPVVEEGTEGVRIMTVHAAKGLEFPVVVLADPTANRVGRNPSRHVDPARGVWAEPLCGCAPRDLLDAREDELRRDDAEAVRLAYVAATRARDLLVAPVVGDVAGDGPLEGWLDVLNPAVYPQHAARRDAEPAPGCPEFGDDSVLDRPERAERGARASVRPGLHRPRAGDHDVTWWDPRALDLGREEELGLRQFRILEADASGAAAERGARANEAWQGARVQTLARGCEPSLRVAPVTALAAERPEAAEAIEVSVERTGVDRTARPSGTRFGTLVHAVLAAVDLDADAAAVAAVARVRGRLLGATAAEVDAARDAAVTALAHPLLRQAAAAAARDELRRETPVGLRLADGTLAEGVVDLAFRTPSDRGGATWHVIDFKTDRELATSRDRYEAQVRLYAEAVARATGEPARATLLSV